MKFCQKALIPLLLCIFCLSACQETESPVNSIPPKMGNSNGNIYNLGIMTQDDYFVYYKNYKGINGPELIKSSFDGLSQQTLLNEDFISLNVWEDWLYYRRSDNYIYRVGTDGQGREQLYDQKVAALILYNNRLYFINYDNRLLYSMNLDGSDIRQVSEEQVSSKWDLYIDQDKIYTITYYDEENYTDISRMNLDGSNKEVVFQLDTDLNRIYLYKNKCICVETFQSIFSIDLDTGEEVEIAKGTIIPTSVNLSGNNLFYSDMYRRAFFRYDLETGKESMILPQSIEFVHIIDGKIFYSSDQDIFMELDFNGQNHKIFGQ